MEGRIDPFWKSLVFYYRDKARHHVRDVPIGKTPTAAAFAGLRRICRYLVTKPHRPLHYHADPIHGTKIVIFEFGPGAKETFEDKQ